MRASHEILEHTAEVKLRIRAADLGELLTEAAHALAAVELGEGTARPAPVSGWRTIAVTSPDREALLVDWLNELIYLAEAERWIPVEFEVEQVGEHHARLRARGITLEVPPAKVKATTHHGLVVRERFGGLEAEVVLDV